MEIHEIKYFLAVCETLNFTRASERCNVSQPALTRAIQNLEAKLGGGPLINRERGKTHLTELGQMMRPYFVEMLGQMEEAKARARAYSDQSEGTLKLGVMCTIGPVRLTELVSGFHRRHPRRSLYLKDASASMLQEQLASGALDVAIYCLPEVLGDRFHVIPLYRERFVVAVAPDHPWANRSAVSFKDLHGQPYLNRANCEYSEHIDAIMAKLGVEPHYPYESERDDWIQSMVMAGMGCTTIPEFAVSLPGLVARPLVEPEIFRTVNLVTIAGRPLGPSGGAFVHDAKLHPWGHGTVDQMAAGE